MLKSFGTYHIRRVDGDLSGRSEKTDRRENGGEKRYEHEASGSGNEIIYFVGIMVMGIGYEMHIGSFGFADRESGLIWEIICVIIHFLLQPFVIV